MILLLTGVWLTFFYRPSANQAWSDLASPTAVSWPRIVHRVASIILVPVCVGLLAVRVAHARQRAGLRVAVSGLGILVLVLVMSSTGYLMPWDQLGLWAVTVGTTVDGVWTAAFDPVVRFILIGGVEISQSTYRFWTLVHVVWLPSVALISLVVTALARRRRRTAMALPAP